VVDTKQEPRWLNKLFLQFATEEEQGIKEERPVEREEGEWKDGRKRAALLAGNYDFSERRAFSCVTEGKEEVGIIR